MPKIDPDFSVEDLGTKEEPLPAARFENIGEFDEDEDDVDEPKDEDMDDDADIDLTV
jgi:hypothetical protein